MIDLSKLSIRRVQDAFVKGTLTAPALASAYLSVIAEKDPTIHAYLEVFSDVAEQANIAQEKIKKGQGTLLTGIPLALKDNILVAGRKASAASRILENFVSPYHSTVALKLQNAGAVLLGRTNMDEFAMGSSTENSAYGVTRNPFDQSRVPGGSSGGSAAAVAMEGALAGLGSDTGGSVRQPASFCGCVGLKPSYGAVSRYGLIALGSSLDQIGCITRTVDDAEIIFGVIAGTDPLDSTSSYPEKISKARDVIRIGVPGHLLETEGIDTNVKKNFDDAIAKLGKMGFEITDVKLPNAHLALAVYYILMPAEASSNLARYDGVKYGLHSEGKDLLDDYLTTRGQGFGKEARRRIILGTYVLSSGYYDAYYNKANAVRALIRRDFETAFKSVDVIATPTTPTPAFKIGEKVGDPLQMYLADIFTVPANISGNPAITLPSGTAESSKPKLPLGLQLVGREYEEATLFAVGKKFLGEV